MPFPPLAAIFLTHFDDVKGQSLIFYLSLDDESIPPNGIEHATLPSGLHLLTRDVVLFTHHHLPGAALFRSRDATNGRRRRMGSVGVVLADGSAEDLFALEPELEDLFDRLEQLDNPFAEPSIRPTLEDIWERHKSRAVNPRLDGNPKLAAGKVKELVEGRACPKPTHPASFLPSLLNLLGPDIVPLYRSSVSGKRILLYSLPPLLPLAAFGWCIWAMGLPPNGTPGSEWLGNVGLMELEEMKRRKDGWVATTSDAIYRSHQSAYDIFIDLSTSLPSLSASTSSLPSPSSPYPTLLASSPSSDPRPVTYTFADLPLYRSLLLLSHSPSEVTITSNLSRQGGVWLLAFELFERVWNLCVGVCEYAVGRGSAGAIQLRDGEEDARPLLSAEVPSDDLPDLLSGPSGINPSSDAHVVSPDSLSEPVDGRYDQIQETAPKDEALRRGRLILRQFRHSAYHLQARLTHVLGQADMTHRIELSEGELRTLCGTTRWTVFGVAAGKTEEGRFWQDLTGVWGFWGISN